MAMTTGQRLLVQQLADNHDCILPEAYAAQAPVYYAPQAHKEGK